LSPTLAEATDPELPARSAWPRACGRPESGQPGGERPAPLRAVRAGLLLAGLLAGLATGCDGCSDDERPASAPDAGVARQLSPAQASQVLARVGERTITLGDYAAALERMDPFERMRYQTEDRRQALLDEMINVELLAREAERRGIDRRPETIELVRQYQRDEVLARLRASLPRPSDLPEAAVSQYYQEHRAEFFEPELRRGAEIVVDDAAVARDIVRQAAGATPERWLELVQKYAPAAAPPPGDRTSPRPPIEVPGDLGYLAAQPDQPSDPLPAAVREALFAIPRDGDVYPSPVAAGGRQHVVRRVSVREARQRSLAEVDALIRVRLIEARQVEARRQLLDRLRASTPLQVEQAALDRVEPPSPAAGASTLEHP
jgi:peptidyl-prolyl cis-trans isomerase C